MTTIFAIGLILLLLVSSAALALYLNAMDEKEMKGIRRGKRNLRGVRSEES